MSSLTVGIDFGTTFSSAAAYLGGKLQFALDERGEACIPSVVYLPAVGPPIIGSAAVAKATSEPQRVVRNLKRILGRKYSDPEVRVFEAQNAVSVSESANGGIIISTPEEQYAPVQLAAAVLKQLRTLAEHRFNQRIDKAVLTVPANWEGPNLDATIKAANMAELEVLRTVPEPCAAAIAYGAGRFQGTRKFLVFDFGGGTFDATVMHQQNASMLPMATGGDPCLGGADLDDAVAQLVAGKIFKETQIDVTRDVVEWALVEQRSEQVKRGLSRAESVRFVTRDIFSRNALQDLDLRLTRPEVEERFKPLVDRAMKATAEVMVGAGISPSDLAATVLVGGTTFTPLVQQRVAAVLKKPGIMCDDPQKVVAAGAAQIAMQFKSQAA